MLARPKITAAANARNYFEMDTYYLNNEFEQGSFYGRLKTELGLDQFNLKDFDSLLKAQNPQTGEELLKLKNTDLDQNGDRKRAACDLTFAADKSISILYEVSDKETKKQIREAFTKSIDQALDFAEANYSFANIGNGTKGKLAQSKMIFARFDHSESRNNDMHLHQHCLAINLIQDKNGQYRSIEFNQIMSNHQLIGQIQRNAFAAELQKIGYEVEITDAKQGTFSLKSIDKELRDQFSTRSKDIKEEMKESGQTSYQATHTAQKQTAKWKDKNKDRAAIQEANIERLKEAGADIEAIKTTNKAQHIRDMNASTAIKTAIIDITDQKSVFSREDILKHALKLTLTTQGADLESLQTEFEQHTELVTIDKDKNQYTTNEVLEKEREIFSQNKNHIFSITTNNTESVSKAIIAFEKEKGFELKAAQNDLTHTILESNKQFIIAQGVAGAGKSTSLEIVRNVCEAEGRRIVALAPTGTATDNLAKEAKIKESYTVAKFIQENGNDIKDAVIIVDEAGMIGLRDTYALMNIAIKNNCKIVFSGDKNQKKSISQGDIFAGMQRQDFETVHLEEGNRQKTDQMRQAVKKILNKDIVGALDMLKNTTSEITDNRERLAAAQTEYLKDRLNTLLITTTNADRRSLNASIRNHLVTTGEITNSKEFTTRETPSLSTVEKRSALYYQIGQSIYLSKNIGSISAGREAEIKAIDINTNTLIVEHKNPKGKTITETVNLSTLGVDLNQFVETKAAFGIGEQIISKKNDTKLGLKNGQIGIVTAIKGDTLTVDFGDKNIKQINLRSYPYIQHAYAITDFASQGKTTNKVLAVANSQSASFNDFYTQITRAKYEAYIITDNIEELRWKAAQESVKLNATELYQNKGLKDENQYSTGQRQTALHGSTNREFDGGEKTKDRDNLRILSRIGLAFNLDRIKSVLQNFTRDIVVKRYSSNTTDKLQWADVRDSQNVSRGEKMKIEKQEFDSLAAKTKEQLYLTDPSPVLDALDIEYKTKNGRYEFKARDEKTASANLYIDKNGEWKYNDFGGGKNGTIENLIMDTTNASYKDALNFAIKHLHVRDFVTEKLNEAQGKEAEVKEIKPLSVQRVENLKKFESQINSKVTNIKEIATYQPALDYLKSRGISKIPPQFKMITGEYINSKGESKKAFGVGIETRQKDGADIHFLQKIGDLKTMSLGAKDISLFKSPIPAHKVAVFESKMDYAAAYQQIDFKDTDIIIANSTSNAHKVAEELKKHKYENVKIYNQNDKAGEHFVEEIRKEADLKHYKYIKYLEHEKEQDINDLQQNGVNIDERSERYDEKEKTFIETLKETHHRVSDLIDLADKAKKIDKFEFFNDLKQLENGDASGAMDLIDHEISNNIDTAKHMLLAAANGIKDVIQNENLSLTSLTAMTKQLLVTENEMEV